MDYQHKSRTRGKDKETERRKRNGGYSRRHIRQCITVKGAQKTVIPKQEKNIKESSYKTKLEKHYKSHGKKNKNKKNKTNKTKTPTN